MIENLYNKFDYSIEQIRKEVDFTNKKIQNLESIIKNISYFQYHFLEKSKFFLELLRVAKLSNKNEDNKTLEYLIDKIDKDVTFLDHLHDLLNINYKTNTNTIELIHKVQKAIANNEIIDLY
jgi:hypothetical protein